MTDIKEKEAKDKNESKETNRYKKIEINSNNATRVKEFLDKIKKIQTVNKIKVNESGSNSKDKRKIKEKTKEKSRY